MNMQSKQHHMLSPGREPGLHTTWDSQLSQQGWDIFRRKEGAHLGQAQSASLPPPCQWYSQAWGCGEWRSGLWHGHVSFCYLFWQRCLLTPGILLLVNIPGKKSKRNTEKARGFPFAPEKLYLGWKRVPWTHKSTSVCMMVLRAVLGAEASPLLQDRSLMSISETAVGAKVWKSRGTSSEQSLPGSTTGNSLSDYFLNTNYKLKGFSKWVPSIGCFWESWFSHRALGNGGN